MRTLHFLLLAGLFFQFGGTAGMGGKAGTGGGPSAACTPPTMTYRWPVYGASNTCNGGGACSNGAALDKLVDVVAANNATQATGANRPAYTTNDINGLPAATFNGTSDVLTMTTGVGFGVVTTTVYAVVRPSNGGGYYPIYGGSASGGLVEWRITPTLHQELLNENQASIGVGTATLSTTNFSTIAFTYNKTSGAYNLYVCSAGTCASDGSGTNAQTINAVSEQLGASTGEAKYFQGDIAEWGFLNSVSTAGIGAYSLCKYGI